MARGDSLMRQWKLIKTLQTHRFGICLEDLAERLECTKRTVQRDLDALQDIFPISHEQRDRGKRYWKLASNTVESEQLQLTVTEILSLFLSKQLLLPLAGTQFGDGLETAFQKIRTLLPARALAYFEGLDDAFFIKSLGHHDYSGQDKEIRILNEATLRQEVLRVTYHSASKGTEVISEFHPYGMVLLHASLYCLGYLACYNEVRTLKVARIKGLTRLEKTFQKPEDFSLARHFQGAFGIFQTHRPQTIRAEFSGWAATNLREMQWHPSQKIIKDDPQSLTATFELDSSVEFKRWILGFGRHARVIHPKDLADDLRSELQTASAIYQ
jgi:predicted DNA-binding transcriptional regulator YafY